MSCNNGKDIIKIYSFSKWDGDGYPQAKSFNVNIQLLFNIPPEDTNISRRKLQENTKAFQSKDKVWRSKLQSCPDTSKVGFIIYSEHKTHVKEHFNNIIKVTKQENSHKMDIAIQSEADFQTEKYRKMFCKKFKNIVKTNGLLIITGTLPQYNFAQDYSTLFLSIYSVTTTTTQTPNN